MMNECREMCLPVLLDELVDLMNDNSQEYVVFTHTEEDGRLLETHMSEISESIKNRCNMFLCNNANSRISLYIRVLGDVSIMACTLLTKDIKPDVIVDLNVIHKENGAGMVIYIFYAESIKEKNNEFIHIENVDALNTNLYEANSFIKKKDGKTVAIKQQESDANNDFSLQYSLEQMVEEVMGMN